MAGGAGLGRRASANRVERSGWGSAELADTFMFARAAGGADVDSFYVFLFGRMSDRFFLA